MVWQWRGGAAKETMGGGFPPETHGIWWWPPRGPPRPSSPALCRPLSRESPCVVVVNDEELPPARVVALARLG